MKWIDMLKSRLLKEDNFVSSRHYSYEDSNGFAYDCSIAGNAIVIYINNSDIGYEFSYSKEGINWVHSENAGELLSDEVKEYFNNLLTSE